MTVTYAPSSLPAAAALADLDAACAAALAAADRLVDALRVRLRARLGDDPDAAHREQARTHGFAWAATYVRALHETLGWSRRLAATSRLGELESLMLQAAFGEYLAQLAGGLPMSQGELFRPDLSDEDGEALAAFVADPAVRRLRARGFAPPVRARITMLLAEGRASRSFGDPAYDDPTLAEIRSQFARSPPATNVCLCWRQGQVRAPACCSVCLASPAPADYFSRASPASASPPLSRPFRQLCARDHPQVPQAKRCAAGLCQGRAQGGEGQEQGAPRGHAQARRGLHESLRPG